MPRRVASALPPVIAALAISLCILTLTGASTAHAAAACHAAPKSPAPQGSHWYYRTDRTLGRKCWYLASEGRKGQAVAPRPAVTDEDANAAPAAPPMAEAAARLTEPLRSPPPPQPPAADWTIAQAAPGTPLPAAPAEPAQSDAASAPIAPQAVTTTQEPIAEPTPAPVIASPPSDAAVPAPARINLMQFVFVAFVGLCLLAGLFPYLAAVRRRREIRIVDLNAKAALRMPTRESRIASPSLAPAEVTDRHDEVDVDEERLRRFSQAWKRQAA